MQTAGPQYSPGVPGGAPVIAWTDPPDRTRVLVTGNGPGALIVDGEGHEWPPAARWLRYLGELGLSPFTVRAYAGSLHRFVRYARATRAPWHNLDQEQIDRYTRWAAQVPPPATRRRAPYSPETISQTVAAYRSFIRFCQER